MEKVNQYDMVLLKDGTEGCAVEVLGEQEIYLVDIGSSPKDWDTVTVKREDIIKVLRNG